MKILKLIFFSLSVFFLSGCFQTTALLGPGITVATSGNVLQAGLQYGANTAVKNETGEYPIEYIKNSVEKKNKLNEKNINFNIFINRIQASRRKLSLN